MHKVSFFSHNWYIIKANNKAVEKILPKINGKVYDLGCGTRPYESEILKYASDYIGVDWGNSVHELKADIICDLNKSLSIKDEDAQVVLSFQVLEHLYNPEKMLNEAYRILLKNGYIFITVPFQWQTHEAPHDYFRYTEYGLKYLLNKAGFVDIEVYPTTGIFGTIILKINYFSTRILRISKILKIILIPFWFVGQLIATCLDIIDNKKMIETSGYYVIARKK